MTLDSSKRVVDDAIRALSLSDIPILRVTCVLVESTIFELKSVWRDENKLTRNAFVLASKAKQKKQRRNDATLIEDIIEDVEKI